MGGALAVVNGCLRACDARRAFQRHSTADGGARGLQQALIIGKLTWRLRVNTTLDTLEHTRSFVYLLLLLDG